MTEGDDIRAAAQERRVDFDSVCHRARPDRRGSPAVAPFPGLGARVENRTAG